MRFAVLGTDGPTAPRVLEAARGQAVFDFASVQRSPRVTAPPVLGASSPGGSFLLLPDGRFEARGQTLENLARVAFGFEGVSRVHARTTWVSIDRFDITASADHPWSAPLPGTTVPPELRTMLRALLEERFALKTRIETTKTDVTALRLVKPDTLGPGLSRSAAACRGPLTNASPDEAPPRPRCPFTSSGLGFHAEAVTMGEAAQLLSQHPLFKGFGLLVDQTELTGLFDVSFQFRRGGAGASVQTVSLDVEEQLGLRLKGVSLPAPMLIIEQASKPLE
jgi:uncharacterized protein (TIGR03435 family)